MEFAVLQPDVIRSIRQRWLLKYWRDLGIDSRSDYLPSWDRIEMAEVARIMDDSVLFDVVREEAGLPRLRIQFQGNRVMATYGTDCRGKFLEDALPPHLREGTVAIYRHVVESRRPTYTVAEVYDADGKRVDHERLALPFGSDGTVSRVLAMFETVSVEGEFENDALLRSRKDMRYSVYATIDT